MKIKRYLAVLFAVLIFLSGCAPVQPEAGSAPNPTSNTPSEGGGEPTIPPETDPTDPVVPTEPEVVINTEVTPKGSFVWSGGLWDPVGWQLVDKENTPFVVIPYEDFLCPLEELPRVSYYGYIPAVLESYPDDTYFLVAVTTHPMVINMYGKPDGSEEYVALLRSTCVELRRRMEEAGYIMFIEEANLSWLETYYGDKLDLRVYTIMSVGEMKAFDCGDDLWVEFDAYFPPNIA